MNTIYCVMCCTWDRKATESHSEDQESNGNNFCVRKTDHQEEGGLHPETWNRETKPQLTNLQTVSYCSTAPNYQAVHHKYVRNVKRVF